MDAVELNNMSDFNLTDIFAHAVSDAVVLAVLDAALSTSEVVEWPSVLEAADRVAAQ